MVLACVAVKCLRGVSCLRLFMLCIRPQSELRCLESVWLFSSHISSLHCHTLCVRRDPASWFRGEERPMTANTVPTEVVFLFFFFFCLVRINKLSTDGRAITESDHFPLCFSWLKAILSSEANCGSCTCFFFFQEKTQYCRDESLQRWSKGAESEAELFCSMFVCLNQRIPLFTPKRCLFEF